MRIQSGLLAAFLLLHAGCASNPYLAASPEERARFKEVRIPLLAGQRYRISAGAFSCCTHHLPGFEYAWDFDVPYGTPVVAVDDGKVIQSWEPGAGGGCDPKYNELAHNVKVLAPEGSVAQYVHVESRVKVGDRVSRGQVIGVTGNNGFHCVPQLHFNMFSDREHLPETGAARSIPVRFQGIPDGLARVGLEGVVEREVVALSEAKMLGPAEQLWEATLRKEIQAWKNELSSLDEVFPGLTGPQRLEIELRNRLDVDAQTSGRERIALSLPGWSKSYGPPDQAAPGRIRRVLSHEYLHLLTQAWLEKDPFPAPDPFSRALLELYYEGIGNFASLSESWVGKDGVLTERSLAALRRNNPILVERLVALAGLKDGQPQQEAALREGLSSGPFSEKWGALSVALWLAKESRGELRALSSFSEVGPAAVLPLLRRNLDSKSRRKLDLIPKR